MHTNNYSAGQTYTPPFYSQNETKLIATSNVQPVTTYTTYTDPHTTVFNKSVEKTEDYNTKEWVVEEMERPYYQKVHSRPQREPRREAPITEEPVKKKKACGTPCWILLGLLGLLGVVFGMLFGLGVFGGVDGPNLNLSGGGINNNDN